MFLPQLRICNPRIAILSLSPFCCCFHFLLEITEMSSSCLRLILKCHFLTNQQESWSYTFLILTTKTRKIECVAHVYRKEAKKKSTCWREKKKASNNYDHSLDTMVTASKISRQFSEVCKLRGFQGHDCCSFPLI